MVRFLVTLFSVIFIFTFFKGILRNVYEVEVTQAVIYLDNQEFTIENNSSLVGRGELLLQASGWVEPDPFPIHVTSLYSGVVKEVHVLEGQTVKEGQVIASLIQEDAKLSFLQADAQYHQSHAEEEIIEADIELTKASLGGVISNVKKEKVSLEEDKDSLKRLESLPSGAVADQDLYRAKMAYRNRKQLLISQCLWKIKKNQ